MFYHPSHLIPSYSIIKKNKDARAERKNAKKTALHPGPALSRTGSVPAVANSINTGGVGGNSGIGGAGIIAPGLTRSSSAPAAPAPLAVDRRHLHNYRVVQRNLVYVIGLPANLGSEEALRKPEYFGQYGRIGKIVIHKTHSNSGGSSTPTISAYVTFVHKDDAKASIQSLEGHWIDNHVLRASFGTTKYCNNFIRGLACNNPDCVYLHEMGNDEDRFTKAEIQAGHSKLTPVPGQNQQLVTGMGGPSGSGKKPIGEPILPPPVFLRYVTNPAELTPTLNSTGTGTGTGTDTTTNPTGAGKPALIRSTSWNSNGIGVPSALTQGLGNINVSGNENNSGVDDDNGDTHDSSINNNNDNNNRHNNGDSEAAGEDYFNNSNAKYNAIGTVSGAGGPKGAWTATNMINSEGTEGNKSLVIGEAPSMNVPTTTAQSNAKLSVKMLERETLQADKRIAAERAQSDRSNKDVAGSTTATAAIEMLHQEKDEEESLAAAKEAIIVVSKDISPATLNSTVSVKDKNQPTTKESLLQISASFNGFGNSAVFTVPVSSLHHNTIWSTILANSKSSASEGSYNKTESGVSLEINPYVFTRVSMSELFDLTLPPVDAIGLPVWPKPISYYGKTNPSSQQQQQQQQRQSTKTHFNEQTTMGQSNPQSYLSNNSSA